MRIEDGRLVGDGVEREQLLKLSLWYRLRLAWTMVRGWRPDPNEPRCGNCGRFLTEPPTEECLELARKWRDHETQAHA